MIYFIYSVTNIAAIYDKEVFLQKYFEKSPAIFAGSLGLIFYILMIRNINLETIQNMISLSDKKIALQMIVENIEESLVTFSHDKIR